MAKTSTTIGSNAIGYITSNGETVVLPAGEDVLIGDMALCQKLADGSYITHGKPKFNIGDSAIGVKTQSGDYVALAPGDIETPDVPSWDCWNPDPALHITMCQINNTQLESIYHKSLIFTPPWSDGITPDTDAILREIIQQDISNSQLLDELNNAIGAYEYNPWITDDSWHHQASIQIPNTCYVYSSWDTASSLTYTYDWYDPWWGPQFSKYPLICSLNGDVWDNHSVGSAVWGMSTLNDNTMVGGEFNLDYFTINPVSQNPLQIYIQLPLEIIESYPDLYTVGNPNG